MRNADDHYNLMSTESLQEHSNWLYEQYLDGADYLGDIHRIGEILRARDDEYWDFETERLYASVSQS
jgi:hypothetical protein